MVRTNEEQQKMVTVLATYRISTVKEIDGGLYGEFTKPGGLVIYRARVAGQFSHDHCTCPHFLYRNGCKHVEALKELKKRGRIASGGET